VGLLYGALALAVLATVSYVTATFMIEAIAGVNAIKKRARQLGIDPRESVADIYSDDNSSTLDDLDSARTEILPLIVGGWLVPSFALYHPRAEADACARPTGTGPTREGQEPGPHEEPRADEEPRRGPPRLRPDQEGESQMDPSGRPSGSTR
jgi:hypothetical protein